MFKNTQNHNYFEEQFEESEANINDRIYEQVTYTKNSDYRTQENKPSVYVPTNTYRINKTKYQYSYLSSCRAESLKSTSMLLTSSTATTNQLV